jgi:hypothetical protein
MEDFYNYYSTGQALLDTKRLVFAAQIRLELERPFLSLRLMGKS